MNIEKSDYLMLHTQFAASLFQGNWKSKKLGLLQFAKVISVLWKAKNADDPYAEWVLLEIDQALGLARQQLKEQEDICKKQLDKLRGMKIEIYQNSLPMKFPLVFSNPLSYMTACFIVDIDFIVRLRQTLKRYGIAAHKEIGSPFLIKMMQDVFNLSLKWKQVNVTRKDIIENNEIAQHAITLFGELPLAVLNKEIKFSFLKN